MNERYDPMTGNPRPAPARRGSTAVVATTALALAAGAFALRANDENAPAQSDAPPAVASPVGTTQLADIIERVQPAVVNISVSRKIGGEVPTQGLPYGVDPRAPEGTPFDEMLRRFFEMQPQRREPMHEAQGLGSGFVVDPAGYIVTNNHVVADADEITVTTMDGTEYEATVQGRDPATDLALLKVDASQPLPAVTFGDSSRVRVGEWVVAMGNPFGLGGTATAGIVSARGRDIQSGPYDDYLQIDAPINLGNSGGPVFDMRGEVIGINTAIFSPNGGSVGIGFAIPATLAQPVVAQLRDSGQVERGWLGVEIQDLTPEAAESLGQPDAKGALVASVAPDSPAARAGVRRGDVIVSFDGKPVTKVRDLTRLVANAGNDEKVRIEVLRAGATTALTARIEKMDSERAQLAFAPPEERARQEAEEAGREADQLGLSLAPLDEDARMQLGLDDEVRGAVVVNVEPDSSAAEQGLMPGDLIEMVGQQSVEDPQQVVDAVAQAAQEKRKGVLLLVRRGADKRFVTLNLG
jgi:serine protease Do